MKVAVNCWILRNKNIDGIGNVVIQTLRPLIQQHPEIEFDLLCDKNFTEDYFNFPNVSIHRIFPPYRHPALYIFYMEFMLPFFLKKRQPDVFIGMDGMISLRSNLPQIAVIHDLNFEHHPKALPLRNRLYYRNFFKRFASKANRIATVSNFSKEDIVKTYNQNPEKIDVLTLGVKEVFSVLTDDEKTETRIKYTEGQPYMFFLGSMHARKNILRLMQAFNLFKQQSANNIKIVLAGDIIWNDGEISSTLKSLDYRNDIIFTGRVSDNELKYLLGSALCLTFVPLFEGFGLPIVEAFQAGVPVICSNITSMPEVAGDAAILVNPFDITEIANAMKKITGDETLRYTLINKALERKKLFTWDTTAKQLFQTIKKTVSQKD